eukprot:5172871-Alexandrium_andersonii.AAC.1
MFARASEEDLKQAISDLGYYVDQPGDSPELARIGPVDNGRIVEFRAQVISACKKSRGIRDDATPVPAKKGRLSTIVDGAAETEVDLLSPERASE